MIIILLAVALLVGGLIGTVGVGGILLIPALSGLGGLTTHAAMATSLFSFIFTGLLGTWLYCKHGSIHWGITIPVCIGGLVGGYPGALANAIAPAWILNLILGCIIIFAGIYALFPAKGGTITYRPGDGRQRLQLLLIGATVGFGSGLTSIFGSGFGSGLASGFASGFGSGKLCCAGTGSERGSCTGEASTGWAGFCTGCCAA